MAEALFDDAAAQAHFPVVEDGGLARGPATADELLSETEDELSSLTAKELRERAKERGLTGVSRWSKRELVEALDPRAGNGG